MGFDYFIHEPSGSGNLRTQNTFIMNNVKFEEFAEKYQVPVVESVEVEVEKGFAGSPDLENPDKENEGSM